MSAEIADDIERVALDDLTPYKDNPKEHPPEQVKKIADSIEEFGFTVPLIIDGDGTIIAGHGRYRAVREHLDMEKVPAIRREDLSESQVRAFRIADNKIAESEWGEETLIQELEAIQDEEDIDIGQTGFDQSEIDDLLEARDESDGVERPEVPFATELLEENNYVVFQFDNKLDWQVIQEEFGLETVKALDSEGDYQQRGVGRVLDGQDLLDRL